MDASNITDKMAKANFLKTLIKALNDDGSLKEVKVAKIIAGKEPEMTNLVMYDSDFKLSGNEAVYKLGSVCRFDIRYIMVAYKF